jgi:hypothetical protein
VVLLRVDVTEQDVHRPRGVEPEGVPPLSRPGVADLAALEDDVLDTGVGEVSTGRHAGRTGAHHHAVVGHPRSIPHPAVPR